MRVISLPIKLLGALVAILLIWGVADNIEYDDILVAEALDRYGVSIASLEDINQNRRMLTYRIDSQKRAEALSTRHDVHIIGTSYTWPFVMSYPILNGGFFSRNEQVNRIRVAVLNEPAALEMFGTLDISGSEMRLGSDRYTITGVLSDGNDEPVIYIPAVLLSNTVSTVIICLEGDFSREAAIGILSGAGVSEPRYSFTDYRMLQQVRRERFLMALYCALSAGLIYTLRKSFSILTQKVSEVKSRLSEIYIFELWQYEKSLAINIAGLSLLSVGISILQFSLILHAFEILLVWNDVLGG